MKRNIFPILIPFALILIALSILFYHPSPDITKPFSAVGSCDSYHITRGSQDTKLLLTKDGWLVENIYPGDSAAIQKLDRMLHAIVTTDAVSDNPDNYSVFRVTEDVIVCSKGIKQYRVYVGKQADANHSYIRIPPDPAVYVTDLLDDILYLDYRDKQPHMIQNAREVTELHLSSGSTTVSFIRSNNGWTRNNSPIMDSSMKTLLSGIFRLKATEIQVQKSQYLFTLSLSLREKGTTSIFRFGQESPEVFGISKDGGPFLYLIPRQSVSFLMEELER